MNDPKTLIWLASYPKSGNTWVRAFLANYLLESDGPAGFEAIERISSGDVSGPSYAELSGCHPARMPPGAYPKVRYQHLSRIAHSGAPVNFVKTHSSCGRIGQHWLIPADLTRQAIYVVRHPLDMLVSYADHWGITLKAAAFQIGADKNMIAPNDRTAAQFLGSWSNHVKGWTQTRDFPVLTLRYEDMLEDPEKAFTRVLHHIGAPVEQPTLLEAIENTSFEKLANLEAEQGFAERGPQQERFFRKGTAGQWKDQVPQDIVEQVVKDHGSVMRKLRYEV